MLRHLVREPFLLPKLGVQKEQCRQAAWLYSEYEALSSTISRRALLSLGAREGACACAWGRARAWCGQRAGRQASTGCRDEAQNEGSMGNLEQSK